MRKSVPINGGCYDPRFKYNTANRTNVRKTWDRLVPGWRNRKPCQSTQTEPVSTVNTVEQTTSFPPAIET